MPCLSAFSLSRQVENLWKATWSPWRLSRSARSFTSRRGATDVPFLKIPEPSVTVQRIRRTRSRRGATSPAKTTASTILLLRPALVQLPLRSRSVVQQDTQPGSERVGDEVCGAGVPGRKVALERSEERRVGKECRSRW